MASTGGRHGILLSNDLGLLAGRALALLPNPRRRPPHMRDAALPPTPPLPKGPVELIYADPPWQLGNPDGRYTPENHYPTLPLKKADEPIAAPKGRESLSLSFISLQIGYF